MGCYDTVIVPCPCCGQPEYFQTKSGACIMAEYKLEDVPADVLFGVNRHSPYECYTCGTKFYVEFETYMPDKHSISVRNIKVVVDKNTSNQ